MSMNKCGKIRLYACGGTGINIAKRVNEREADMSNGFASISRVFVDTSYTNVDATVPEESIFIVGRDTAALGNHRSEGSGKNRLANEEEIAGSVDNIMSKYPPMDLNIVVFNASGGTGSVAGPFIMNWLLEMGQNAVALVIGNEASAQAATNTFDTLKTLDKISALREAPLVVNYLHQTRTNTRDEMDQHAIGAITSLSILASRQNDELDMEDIHNLFNYTEVCDVHPQLTLLEIFVNKDEVEELYKSVPVIGMGAILGDKSTVLPDVKFLYDAVGYYHEENHRTGMYDLYYVITTHGMDKILKTMQENEEESTRILAGQTKRVSFSEAATTTRRGKSKESKTGLL